MKRIPRGDEVCDRSAPKNSMPCWSVKSHTTWSGITRPSPHTSVAQAYGPSGTFSGGEYVPKAVELVGEVSRLESTMVLHSHVAQLEHPGTWRLIRSKQKNIGQFDLSVNTVRVGRLCRTQAWNGLLPLQTPGNGGCERVPSWAPERESDDWNDGNPRAQSPRRTLSANGRSR